MLWKYIEGFSRGRGEEFVTWKQDSNYSSLPPFIILDDIIVAVGVRVGVGLGGGEWVDWKGTHIQLESGS